MPAGRPFACPPGRFEFATAARIVFGENTSRELPEITAAFGRRVFLVTGSSATRHRELVDALTVRFESIVFASIATEPTVSIVESLARDARDATIDVVIALGGGSVIDAGKAIAALAANPGPALDYLEVVGRGQPLSHPSLPVIAVPTTAGTGAEVTRNAVLSVPDARVKVSLRSASMLPRVAIVDPVLTFGLPSSITTTTAMDALTQLIEPFISSRANPFVDALCRDGIARAAAAIPAVAASPGNTQARSELSLAALYSGMALANAGLGVVHGFAAPIGGMFTAPHGAVCAALLPGALRTNLAALRARAPEHTAMRKMHVLAQILTGDSDATADDAVNWCENLAHSLAIPRLSAWGVRTQDVGEIVARAAKASSMKGNPIALTDLEMRETLLAAL